MAKKGKEVQQPTNPIVEENIDQPIAEPMIKDNTVPNITNEEILPIGEKVEERVIEAKSDERPELVEEGDDEESADDVVYTPEDIARLDREARAEAEANGTLSSVSDNVRQRLLVSENKAFISLLEKENPNLRNFNPVELARSFTGASRASYTQEEMVYFMANNFDYFQINGTLLENRGKMIGTSGCYMPTGNNYVVCTIQQFADIIGYEPDGSNWGIHKSSYADSKNKTWYNKKITKYNLSKFLVDYCEGNIARMDGVGSLTSLQKEVLMDLAKKYEIKK